MAEPGRTTINEWTNDSSETPRNRLRNGIMLAVLEAIYAGDLRDAEIAEDTGLAVEIVARWRGQNEGGIQ